ncbi:MAG: hypothetical protein FWD34_09385 [Oscillospiraceae bacterium]|nr:hypothetical protein [Oscillospiraceae bacterium]
MKIKLPPDVQRICEEVIRGYERRREDYEQKRLDIIYTVSGNNVEFSPNNNISAPTQAKAERLEKLENSMNVRFVRAVEQSLAVLGSDLPRDSRERLRTAVILNIENNKEYPYEVLGIDDFSRREFYRRRSQLIQGVAMYLGLIE